MREENESKKEMVDVSVATNIVDELAELLRDAAAAVSRLKLYIDLIPEVEKIVGQNEHLKRRLSAVSRERDELARRCRELERMVQRLMEENAKLREESERLRAQKQEILSKMGSPELGARLIAFLRKHGCGDDLWYMLSRHDPELFDRLWEVVYGWIRSMKPERRDPPKS